MSPSLLKALQARKIAEIRTAFHEVGVYALDAQAEALGLPRSTAYTVVDARHKASGISARVIAQMLRSPRLPPLVRAVVLEYARAKAVGVYGGDGRQRRRFCATMLRCGACIEGDPS